MATVDRDLALQKAKLARKSIRSAVTKTVTNIEAQLKDKSLEKTDLEESLAILSKKEEELIKLDWEVRNYMDDLTELENDLATVEVYSDKIVMAKTKSQRTLQNLNASASLLSTPSSSNANLNINNGHSIKDTVQLPIISMKKFNGDRTKWNAFWSQFKVTVDDKTQLSKVEKLTYLISLLEGEAEGVIDKINYSDQAYDDACKQLHDRYDRTDLMQFSLMMKLFEMEPVLKTSDTKGLRKLIDSCEVHVRSLKHLGADPKTHGMFLCPTLLRIMPKEIRHEYIKIRVPNSPWDADHLITFLKGDITLRETTEVLGNEISQNQKSVMKGLVIPEKLKVKNDYNKGPKGTTAVLATGMEKQGGNVFCIFCKSQNHSSNICTNFDLSAKQSILSKENRCFNCLKMGHNAKKCYSRFKSCKLCQGKHNVAVCEKNEVNWENQNVGNNQNKNNQASNEQATTVKSVYSSSIEATVILQTAKTAVLNPSNRKKTIVRCLLDTGSQGTFIKEKVSRNLNLPVIGEEKIKFNTFLNENSKVLQCRRVALTLQNIREPQKTIQIEAIEVPYVCRSVTSINNTEIREIARKKGIELADDIEIETDSNDPSSIELLIGADNYWELVPPGKFEKLGNSLIALETEIGWVVQGRSQTKMGELASYSITCMKVSFEEKEVVRNIKSLWELEAIGIDGQEIAQKKSDEEMLETFEKETTFEKGRYVVKLPWKIDKSSLPDNFSLAMKRFKPLLNRFQKDPIFFDKYKKVIEEQLKLGIIEEVKIGNVKTEKEGLHYLPHQGVVNEQRATTKLRVVLDGSAHEKGKPSLNNCLETGPNLNPDLLSLILRFRSGQIGIVADMEKAFLQVGLHEDERDSVRFIWIVERNGKIDPYQFKILRMTRLPFGLSSSSYELAATIKMHLKSFMSKFPEVFEKLNNDLYYDDLVTCVNNVDNGIGLIKTSQEIFKAAGMTLGKWKTNSKELQKLLNIRKEEGGQKFLVEKSIDTGVEKVLGIRWDICSDTLSYDFTNLIKYICTVKPTKRCLLSVLAQIFDPMGILGPYVVRAKMLFQETWLLVQNREIKLDWDDELPPRIAKEFKQWYSELDEISKIEVPRYYRKELEGEIEKHELHCFTDSSMKAFSAVVYLRTENIKGKIHTCFVCAKTRVAPIKAKLTISRLELTGCLIGARLVKFIKDALKNSEIEVTYWTDSAVALGWIKSEAKEWKQFVSNRVNDIQNISDKLQWKHCTGLTNPADLPTRGVKASELLENEMWLKGPSWLRKPRSEWPRGNPSIVGYESEINEEKQKTVMLVQSGKIVGIQRLINLENYSFFARVVRVTSYILRFINKCRKLPTERGTLKCRELDLAEKKWIKDIQSEDYCNEIESLKKGQAITKSSKIYSLNPILDNKGLLRVGGRLDEANLQFEIKHPIILSKQQRLSVLLIRRSHVRMLHSGINSTITDLRERYWIISARQLTKNILKKCVICNKINARAGKVNIAQLPKSRIIETPPFETIGLDFAGPLLIRTKAKQIMKKVYILLITCAVTRALHLELVGSMNTEEFLLAMNRFMSRRGIPRIIYSDNAKTFKRADADYKEIWKNLSKNEIEEYYGKEGIVWNFIAERAAWWGGMYERMVRTTKNILKKIIGSAALNYTEMETILTQTEAIINSRPITYVYNDHNEPNPLTPAHFLIGQRIKSLPNRKIKQNETFSSTRKELIVRWKYRQLLMDKLWKRWRTEYLLNLRSVHHIEKLIKKNSVFKPGDIVIIHDDKQPRQNWSIGVITQTQPGRDGLIRSCLIRQANGNVLRRPVQLLYLMELPDD